MIDRIRRAWHLLTIGFDQLTLSPQQRRVTAYAKTQRGRPYTWQG